MDDSYFTPAQRQSILDAIETYDLYLPTVDGGVRRTTQPRGWYWYTAYVLETDGEAELPEFMLDSVAEETADKYHCTYADAVLRICNATAEWDKYRKGFDAICESHEYRYGMLPRFDAKQAALERRWREEHNDWRDPLPPDFT